MNNKILKKHRIVRPKPNIKFIILSSLLASIFSQAYAQYEIKKHTINSGGSKISGGSYELHSSIGQNSVSSNLTGENYVLSSGYWQENTDLIFKNNF